jgi:type II secretory pathway component PulL
MADTVFCLDIADDAVTGVLVDRSSKATVIEGCGYAELKGMPLDDGVVQVCRQAGFTGGPCRLSLGCEFFSFRNLSLPFSDRKKIAQIIPFELENVSAAEADSTLVDFLVSASDQQETGVVTAAIEKELLASFFSTFGNLGIDPDIIEIRGVRLALRLGEIISGDYLFLDICPTCTGLTAVSGGRVVLIRSLPFDSVGMKGGIIGDLGLRVRQTLLASQIFDLEKKKFTVCLIGGGAHEQQLSAQLVSRLRGVEIKSYRLDEQPLVKLNPGAAEVYRPRQMDPVLALSLKAGVKSKGFDFRKDEFKRKKSTLELRTMLVKAGVPLALILIIAASYFGYNYKMLKDRKGSLQHQIIQQFHETLPEVKRVVNPLQQLQVKINEISKTYGGRDSGTGPSVLSLLTEISARIPKSYPVVVKRLVADSDTVRIKAVTRDFNTVDNIQKELEKSSYFQTVTISSANQSPEGDEVRFELKIELQ